MFALKRSMALLSREMERGGGGGSWGSSPKKFKPLKKKRPDVSLNYYICRSTSVDEALATIEANLALATEVNYATVFNFAAKRSEVPTEERRAVRSRLARLFEALKKHMQTEEPKGKGHVQAKTLSVLSSSLTKLGLYDQLLFNHISQKSLRLLHEFPPQSLVPLLWALAKTGHGDGDVFRGAAEILKPNIDLLHPQEVSMLLWSFATCGIRDAELFGSALRAAQPRLPDFSPQSIANVMWACGALGVSGGEEFVSRACGEAARRASDFKIGESAMLLWGISRGPFSHLPPPVLCARLADNILSQLPSLSSSPTEGPCVLPGMLSLSAFSLASIGCVHARLLQTLMHSANKWAADSEEVDDVSSFMEEGERREGRRGEKGVALESRVWTQVWFSCLSARLLLPSAEAKAVSQVIQPQALAKARESLSNLPARQLNAVALWEGKGEESESGGETQSITPVVSPTSDFDLSRNSLMGLQGDVLRTVGALGGLSIVSEFKEPLSGLTVDVAVLPSQHLGPSSVNRETKKISRRLSDQTSQEQSASSSSSSMNLFSSKMSLAKTHPRGVNQEPIKEIDRREAPDPSVSFSPSNAPHPAASSHLTPILPSSLSPLFSRPSPSVLGASCSSTARCFSSSPATAAGERSRLPSLQRVGTPTRPSILSPQSLSPAASSSPSPSLSLGGEKRNPRGSAKETARGDHTRVLRNNNLQPSVGLPAEVPQTLPHPSRAAALPSPLSPAAVKSNCAKMSGIPLERDRDGKSKLQLDRPQRRKEAEQRSQIEGREAMGVCGQSPLPNEAIQQVSAVYREAEGGRVLRQREKENVPPKAFWRPSRGSRGLFQRGSVEGSAVPNEKRRRWEGEGKMGLIGSANRWVDVLSLWEKTDTHSTPMNLSEKVQTLNRAVFLATFASKNPHSRIGRAQQKGFYLDGDGCAAEEGEREGRHRDVGVRGEGAAGERKTRGKVHDPTGAAERERGKSGMAQLWEDGRFCRLVASVEECFHCENRKAVEELSGVDLQRLATAVGNLEREKGGDGLSVAGDVSGDEETGLRRKQEVTGGRRLLLEGLLSAGRKQIERMSPPEEGEREGRHRDVGVRGEGAAGERKTRGKVHDPTGAAERERGKSGMAQLWEDGRFCRLVASVEECFHCENRKAVEELSGVDLQRLATAVGNLEREKGGDGLSVAGDVSGDEETGLRRKQEVTGGRRLLLEGLLSAGRKQIERMSPRQISDVVNGLHLCGYPNRDFYLAAMGRFSSTYGSGNGDVFGPSEVHKIALAASRTGIFESTFFDLLPKFTIENCAERPTLKDLVSILWAVAHYHEHMQQRHASDGMVRDRDPSVDGRGVSDGVCGHSVPMKREGDWERGGKEREGEKDREAERLDLFWWAGSRLTSGKAAQIPGERDLPPLTDFASSRDLGQLSTAFMKMGVLHGRLMESIAAVVVRDVMSLSPLAISSFLGAAGRLQWTGLPGLLDSVRTDLERIVPRFGPLDLAWLCWAIAKSGELGEDREREKIMKTAEETAMRKMQEFRASSLCAISWALAKSGTGSPEFFLAASRQAVQVLGRSASSCSSSISTAEDSRKRGVGAKRCTAELSTFAWSLGQTVNSVPTSHGDILRFFEFLQKDIERFGLRDFVTADLCNIAWAAGTAKFWSKAFFEAVGNEMLRSGRLQGGDVMAKDLTSLLVGFARAGVAMPSLFRVACLRMKALADISKLQTASADEHGGHEGDGGKENEERVPRSIVGRETKTRDQREEERPSEVLQAQQLLTFLWALAQANIAVPSVFDSVASHLVLFRERDGLDELMRSIRRRAYCLWSVAVPFALYSPDIHLSTFREDSETLLKIEKRQQSAQGLIDAAVLSRPSLVDLLKAEQKTGEEGLSSAELKHFALAGWSLVALGEGGREEVGVFLRALLRGTLGSWTEERAMKGLSERERRDDVRQLWQILMAVALGADKRDPSDPFLPSGNPFGMQRKGGRGWGEGGYTRPPLQDMPWPPLDTTGRALETVSEVDFLVRRAESLVTSLCKELGICPRLASLASRAFQESGNGNKNLLWDSSEMGEGIGGRGGMDFRSSPDFLVSSTMHAKASEALEAEGLEHRHEVLLGSLLGIRS
eukprot:Cvel_17810.t1-p1 / transcript=Cvel_17810.t1 / gene=Cvel_17810 / organism=Chromera_velia_CCMP2878 / gene_product=hypothetical protein / transcript_product=hypothetical protein / location=Cvel_scaffold1442:39411-47224(+) / protein_length=2102 / sequence_SO=supercontig / SO=protein_coding / is_pseudo=false